MPLIGPAIRRGGTLLPPEIFPDTPFEEKEKDIVVNQSVLNQGQLEYQFDRAQKLQKGMALQEQPANLSDAMRQAGAELQNPDVEKDGPWWNKALKVLQPLNYIDIPMELAFEVVEGVIPGQWAGEANVESRKDWEAWTALFGSGQGSFKERLDKAEHAISKRPWWAELGIGAVQIAVTGGTSVWLKGAQAAGKGIRAAQIARGGAMVLDPWEVGFMGVRAGYRGGKNMVGKGQKASIGAGGVSTRRMADNISSDDYEDLLSSYDQQWGMGGREGVVIAGRGKMAWNPKDVIRDVDGRAVGIRSTRPEKASPEVGGVQRPPKPIKEWETWQVHQQAIARAVKEWGLPVNDAADIYTNPKLIDKDGPTPAMAEILSRLVPEPPKNIRVWTGEEFVDHADWAPDVEIFDDIFNPMVSVTPDDLWGSNALPRYALQGRLALRNIGEDVGFRPLDDAGNEIAVLPGMAQRGNVLRELNVQTYQDWQNATIGSNERLLKARNLLTFVLGTSVGSRQGHTFGATAGSIFRGAIREGKSGKLRGRTLINDDILEHIDTKNGVSMVFRPLDIGDAKLAAEVYTNTLVEWSRANADFIKRTYNITIDPSGEMDEVLKWIDDNDQILTLDLDAIKGKRLFRNNEKIFAGQNAKDVTLNKLLKEVKDSDPERWALVPDQGRLFRQQKATEMILEYDAYENVARQLNHGSTAPTTGYIRAIPYVGENSPLFKDSLSTREMIGAMGSEGADEWIDIAVKATQGAPVRRVKGMEKGAVDLDRMAIEVGHAAMQTKAGREALEPFMPEEWQLLFNKRFSENIPAELLTAGSEGAKLRDYVQNAMRLIAVIRKADAIERTTSFASHTKKAINHDYGSNKTRLNMYRNQFNDVSDKPGLLNRAGYFRIGDEIEWGGTGTKKAFDHWGGKREALRVEMGLPREIFGEGVEGMEDAWLRWGQNLWKNWQDADKILDNSRLRGVQGKPVKFHAANVLREYADIETHRLVNDYGALSPDIKQRFGFDNLFSMLAAEPVGKTGRAMGKNYFESAGRAYQVVWNDLNNMISNNQTFNGLWRTTRGGQRTLAKQQDLANEFRDAVPMSAFTEWLKHPDVVTAMQLVRINGSTPANEIIEKIQRMSDRSPRLFGDDWAAYIAKHPEQARRWVKIVGTRVANNKHLWTTTQALAEHADEPIDELSRLRALRPGRGRNPYAPGLREGRAMALASEVSGIPTMGRVELNVSNIATLTNLFGRNFQSWINEAQLYKKVLKTFVINPVFSVFQGGKAGIAPLITRGLSARAHMYPTTEQVGDQVHGVFRDIGGKVDTDGSITGLGLYADKATPEMLAAKIDEGHQFFKVLDDLLLDRDEIYKWEVTDEARNANLRYAPSDSVTNNGGVYHRFDSALRGDDANIRKFMTQVDILMERVRPEHWKHYFKGVAHDGENAHIYNQILYLRDVFFQVDELARARKVDLVKIVDDRGVEYLDDYFSRFYKQTRAGIKITKDNNGILGNGAEGFFKEREIDDIVNVLARSVGTTKGIEPLDWILEDFAVRAGKYVESVQKKIIDVETVEWLKKQPEFVNNRTFATQARIENDALNALELLVNQQARGEGASLSADSLERVKSFWGAGKGQALAIDGWDMRMFDEAAETISESARKKITSQIKKTREGITADWGSKLGSEKGGDGADWLRTTLQGLSLKDQRALEEYAMLTTRNFGQDALKWTGRGAAPVSALLKYFKSGIDVGAPMIHGFNSLVRIPINRQGRVDWASQKAWLKGVKKMAEFWWKPERYEQFKLENLPAMTEARQYMRYALPEPLMVTESTIMQNVRKWASRKLPEHEHMKFLSRFEAGFSGFLDVLRTEIWSAMKVSVDRELGDMAGAASKAGSQFDMVTKQNEMYHDLGATINKMTGAFDPHLAQQTPFQTLVENSLVFFAPMYRRATFGILADIFRYRESGGVRSEQALRQLGGVLSVGAAMGVLAEMTGNNPRGFLFDEEGELGEEGELDLTARFGKFNAYGVQTGIGGAWWTAMRVASDIAMHFATQDEDGTIELDKDSHWADHWFFNFMNRRGRSQLAPATGLATDLFSGRTFIGEPLRDGDEIDWAANVTHAASYSVPFWLDGMFHGNSWQGRGIAMASEFMGLQSYPLSSWDKLSAAREDAILTTTIPTITEWRDGRIAQGLNPNYINMPRTIQNILNENETNVRLLQEEHEEKYGRIASGNARDLRLFMKEKNDYTLKGIVEIAQFARQWEMGQGGIEFKDVRNMYKTIKQGRRIHNNTLLEKYPALGQYFSELRAGREDKVDVAFVGDLYYDKWQAVRNDPAHTDSTTGLWRPEMAAIAEEEFWADPHAAQFKEYIIDRNREWLEVLPSIRAFEDAQDVIKASGYWSVHDLIWEPGSAMNIEAEKYLKWTRDMQVSMRQKHPKWKMIDDKISDRRLRIRQTNAEVDRLLLTYEYTTVARHPSNRRLKEKLMLERVPGNEKTAHFERFTISPTGKIIVQ